MKSVILALVLFVVAALASQPLAMAYNPFDEVCRDNPDNSVCTTTSKDPISGKDSIVPRVANILAAVGGIIAVVMVMVNGLTIMTSTGDSAKINKARDGLIYAAVGIAVIALARVIVALIMRFV